MGEVLVLKRGAEEKGIKGKETLVHWVRTYGREDIFPKRVRMETGDTLEVEGALRKHGLGISMTDYFRT